MSSPCPKNLDFRSFLLLDADGHATGAFGLFGRNVLRPRWFVPSFLPDLALGWASTFCPLFFVPYDVLPQNLSEKPDKNKHAKPE